MGEQISIFDILREPFKIDKPIRLIELFAGYGSQAMALKRLGADFEHYKVVEFDKYAMASYNAIHGTDFPTIDVNDIHGEDLGINNRDKYTYILTYSFPCTDISVAGLMQGMSEDSGTRSSLLWQVKRILSELKEINSLPDVLLMENVPEVHGDRNIKDFNKWTDFLEELGYSSYLEDLNASDYGVAQNRLRTFMVSLPSQYNYNFPNSMDLRYCMQDYFEVLTEEQAMQLVVKSPKAHDLLVKLDAENRLF